MMSDETPAGKEEIQPGAPAETFQFQTEVSQLLNILVHSLYTKREIFLRELVSNAADALSKVQFELLTRRDVTSPDAELAVQIDFDLDAKTLTISDTGVGMTREELIGNIGTIAHSGSRDFVSKLLEQKQQEGSGSPVDLIGQFGVGFYSAFMVADKVEVETKSMEPAQPAWKWTSDGQGSFSVEPSDRAERGTTVKLHLKEDASEFLATWRLEEIVKTYSNYVPFPVKVKETVANRQKAIWAQSRSEVTEEAYHEFYGHLAHTSSKPLAHLHLQADVPIQFSALLYVPHEAPLWYSPMEQKHQVRLHVKRVFIQESCEELLPRYLRFLVGVVDVDDLPLNVGRELIQKNPVLEKVSSNLTRKMVQVLQELADKEPEKYITFWRGYGMFLKEGVREELKQKDALAELLRFNSSHHVDGEGLTSLKEYVARMPEGQEEIYYFSGSSREQLERSPHLEAFRKRHYEVLYMTDAIDPLVVMSMRTYKEKKFRIIDDPSLKLPDEQAPESTPAAEELTAFMKQVLGEKVEDVRLCGRVMDSPARLVNPESAMSSDMQRLYSMMDKEFKMGKKILEVNPGHVMIQNLAQAYQGMLGDPGAQEKLRPYVHHILDTALLAEGLHPNPAQLVSSLHELLTIATGTLVSGSRGDIQG